MSALQSPEMQAKMAIWRQKALTGDLTMDEMKEAVQIMREGRLGASHASETSRRKVAKAEIKSADDLLEELGGL